MGAISRNFGAVWDRLRQQRATFRPSADSSAGGTPTEIVSGREALQNARRNHFNHWNRSTSSLEISAFENDASRRIFDRFAALAPNYSGPKLQAGSGIFAMGSCFAREIERALIARRANVVSVGESMQRDEFRDPTGKVRDGFLHRFTPRSMSQEFAACFDELPRWTDQSLIFPQGPDRFLDLNYWQVPGADEGRQATDVRRSVAKALVRRAADADLVIVTLGLTEAWLHKPSALFANFTTPQFLAKHRDAFALHLIGVDETIESLEAIDAILRRHHRTGKYQIVVTVSPVPLSATFTDKDIVVANMDSKSTLRSAAAAFVARHDHAHYFPSFEMVTYSDPSLAWRPDRIHVTGRMIDHVVSTFVNTYYEEGAFAS